MNDPMRALKAQWPAYVRGKLADDCHQPNFAKAATESSRTFWLSEGFELQPNFVELARVAIVEHDKVYALKEHFPIDHYVLHLLEMSVRFMPDGEVLGMFDADE